MKTEAIMVGSEVFSDKYKPAELKFRKEQIEIIRFCLQNRQSKVNVFLHGPSGSGTVGVVAKRLGRNFILIDVSPDYCTLARKRVTTAA
jgi:DNA modification methylase